MNKTDKMKESRNQSDKTTWKKPEVRELPIIHTEQLSPPSDPMQSWGLSGEKADYKGETQDHYFIIAGWACVGI